MDFRTDSPAVTDNHEVEDLSPPAIFRPIPELRARRSEFTYSTVNLLREETCGTGSYGSVCKANVDDLLCAAKIIHPTFFQLSELDPNSTRMMSQFERECDFLSAIRHPCIVQYLGTYHDPESGMPVLLMELMDESLTKFLERTQLYEELVPYHVQVNICHDVLMALSFLHSNGILHRDLSSNNILLIAGSKAKVTDFGMSKLMEVDRRLTPLTQCPGTMVYMPPEALRIPPNYSDKLDIFATGVIIIQIITCRFPNPTVAKKVVEDPRHGTIEVPVPERERRKEDIDSVDIDHPLRPFSLDCLADHESNRPSSSDLCQYIAYLKNSPRYTTSLTEAQERDASIRHLEHAVVCKDEEIEALRIELEQKTTLIETLRQSFDQEKNEALMEKDNEMDALRQHLVKARMEVDSMHRSLTVSEHYENDVASQSEDSIDIEGSDVLERQLNLVAPSSALWYHGLITRSNACQRLEEVGAPGAYMIRLSQSERGQMVLSFLDRLGRVHHFKISQRQNRYNIGGTIWFSTLSNLVGFHTKYSSVVEKSAERLDVPVAPPSPVTPPPHINVQ